MGCAGGFLLVWACGCCCWLSKWRVVVWAAWFCLWFLFAWVCEVGVCRFCLWVYAGRVVFVSPALLVCRLARSRRCRWLCGVRGL